MSDRKSPWATATPQERAFKGKSKPSYALEDIFYRGMGQNRRG